MESDDGASDDRTRGPRPAGPDPNQRAEPVEPTHVSAASGLLVAGGHSRRMGTDKRWLSLNGRPVVAYALQALTESCVDVTILGGPGDLGALRAAFPHVPVRSDAGEGPLPAVAGALATLTAAVAVVLAADQPLVTARFLRSIVHALEASGGDDLGSGPSTLAVVPIWDDRLQVLSAAYRRELHGPAMEAVQSGERSIARWVESLGPLVRFVPEREWRQWDPRAQLVNLNTTADYQALTQRARTEDT